MGVLSSCYSLVGYMLRWEGLQRLYFLGYFVHPVPILLCELYVRGRILVRWLISASIYPCKLARSGVSRLVVMMGLDDASIIELYGLEIEEDEEEVQERWFAVDEEEDPYTSITLYGTTASRAFPPRYGSPVVFDQLPLARECRWREEPEESPAAVVCHSIDVEEEDHGYGLVRRSGKEVRGEEYCKEESPEREEEELVVDDVHETRGSFDEDLASLRRRSEQDREFYQGYAKWMGIHDLIMTEWLTVISDLLRVGIRELLGDTKTHMRILYQKLESVGVDLAKSMELGLETVYVGQSCLCWEALEKSYRRFEELAAEGRTGASSSFHEAAEKFQHFHVRLERFRENERYDGRYEGKRFWNYLQGRLVCGSLLLQVPFVSGHAEEENECDGSESMTVEQVLLIIEDCIRSFSYFLDADNVRSGKKPPKGWLPGDLDPPVEDVNDLGLKYSLIRKAREKERELKKLQKGKKHWWSKRTAVLDNSQKTEVLFSMVDIKLVSRVLKMSFVPYQHLQWCENKLSSIHISEGNITRTCQVSFFPPA